MAASKAYTMFIMFGNATSSNQNLCSWGDQLSTTTNVFLMIQPATSCPADIQGTPDLADTPRTDHSVTPVTNRACCNTKNLFSVITL
jgi:hypothetical protein